MQVHTTFMYLHWTTTVHWKIQTLLTKLSGLEDNIHPLLSSRSEKPPHLSLQPPPPPYPYPTNRQNTQYSTSTTVSPRTTGSDGWSLFYISSFYLSNHLLDCNNTEVESKVEICMVEETKSKRSPSSPIILSLQIQMVRNDCLQIIQRQPTT